MTMLLIKCIFHNFLQLDVESAIRSRPILMQDVS